MDQSKVSVSASQMSVWTSQKRVWARVKYHRIPVKSVTYLDRGAAEYGVNEHVLLTISFHLQQPTRVALNEIQKWT